MSTPKAVTKVKERRHSVNVTMSVVHKTNRSEDKKLERHVEHLKQKEHSDKVRHCTEVRKIEKEFESMQIQVERGSRTFTRRETMERDVPYMFGQKIAASQPRKIRRRSHRGDSAAAALNKVASNVDLGGKSRFRSAVMAVCVTKGLGSTGSSPRDQTNEQETSEEKAVITEDKIMSGSGRGGFTRARRQTHPVDRPFTSPVKNSRRSSSYLRPASTSLDGMRSSQGINPNRSASRRHTVTNLLRLPLHMDSPSPYPATLPDLVNAARATIVHAAESAKAASILKRRGSAVNTVTAAERELERRRSSAALRMQEIKSDLTRRDGDLQDRIKLFIKTGMPGESYIKLTHRPLSVLPLELHSVGSNESE